MKKKNRIRRILAALLVMILAVQMGVPLNVNASPSALQETEAASSETAEDSSLSQETTEKEESTDSQVSETAPVEDTFDGSSDFVIENGVLVQYLGTGGDVEIPEGVVTIGEEVFNENTSIKNVVIPSTVTTIESKAFLGTSLDSITFKGTLQTIADDAFYSLFVDTSHGNHHTYSKVAKFGKIILSDAGAKISGGNINKILCPSTKVKTFELTSDATTLGYWKTYQVTLENIIVQEGNSSFVTYDGVLYKYIGSNQNSGLELYSYPQASPARDSLVLPDNLHRITADVTNVASVTFNSDISALSENSLTTARFPNTTKITIGSNVKSLCEDFFSDVTFPKLTTTEISEANEAFTVQDGVVYSKDMTVLYRYPAYKFDLDVFEIPDSVKVIKTYAFYYENNNVIDYRFEDESDITPHPLKVILPKSLETMEYYSIVSDNRMPIELVTVKCDLGTNNKPIWNYYSEPMVVHCTNEQSSTIGNYIKREYTLTTYDHFSVNALPDEIVTNELEISGTCAPDASVSVYVDEKLVLTATGTESATWNGTITFEDTDEDIIHAICAEYIYPGLNLKVTEVHLVNLLQGADNLPLFVPEKTGIVNPFIHGKTMPSQTVSIYVNGELYTTVEADITGRWNLNLNLPDPAEGKEYEIKTSVTMYGQTFYSNTKKIVYTEDAVPSITQVNYTHRYNKGSVNPETHMTDTIIYNFFYPSVFRFEIENDSEIETLELLEVSEDGSVIYKTHTVTKETSGKWICQIPGTHTPLYMAVKCKTTDGSEKILYTFENPWIIDPSGYVYEAVSTNRYEGAEVTIYYKKNLSDSDAIKWDAAPYYQKNPLTTDDDGFYAWDVPKGYWKVCVDPKDSNYLGAESEWLPVPPAQTDINLEVIYKKGYQSLNATGFENKLYVTFPGYVKVSTVKAEDFTVSGCGTALTAAPVKTYTRNDEQIAQEFVLVFENDFSRTGNDIKNLTVDAAGIETYAGVLWEGNAVYTTSFRAEDYYIRALNAPAAFTVVQGKTATFEVSLEGKGDFSNLYISAYDYDNDDVIFYFIDENGDADDTWCYYETDENGIATITLEGLQLGSSTISLNINNITLSVPVEVVKDEALANTVNELLEQKKEEEKAEDPGTENEEIEDAISLKDDTIVISLSNDSFIFSGSEIKPEVTVTHGDITLTEGTDYTLSYKNNIHVGSDTEAPRVIVLGKGNYRDFVSVSFTITPKQLAENSMELSKSLYEVTDYTTLDIKEGIKPGIIIKDGETLLKDTDYTVTYTGNNEIGTAMVTVTAINDYSGTFTKEFTIKGIDLAKVAFDKIPTQYCINGACTVSPTVSNKSLEQFKVEDISFLTYYEKNDKPGTATVYLYGGEGTNTYGKKKLTFKINKLKLSEENLVVGSNIDTNKNVIAGIDDVTYTGEKQTPFSYVAVTVDGKQVRLSNGIDYTVSYSNNINVGKRDKNGNIMASAKITIKGKGNYTGSVSKTFKILPRALGNDAILDEAFSINAQPMLKYTGKNVKPVPKLTFTNANGKSLSLKSGKDYTVTCTEKGAKNQTAEVAYTITGKGNYTGYVSEKVWVTDEKITVKVSSAKRYYTGTPVTLSPSEISVYRGKELVASEHYTVSYANNTDAGTASLHITGDGVGFIGQTGATFKIIPQKLSVANIQTEIPDSVPYYGNAVTLDNQTVITNLTTDTTLIRGIDYKVKYSGNTKPGKATMTITGIGNYSGSLKNTFTIDKIKDFSSQYIYMYSVEYSTTNPYVVLVYYPDGVGNGNGYTLNQKNTYTVKYERTETGYKAVVKPKKSCYAAISEAEMSCKFSAIHLGYTTASLVKTQIYKGKAVTPKVTLKYDGYTLKENTDYTITYSNNDKRGIGTITIDGKGSYRGRKTIYFLIF